MSTVVNEAFWMRHLRMRFCGRGVVEKRHSYEKILPAVVGHGGGGGSI